MKVLGPLLLVTLILASAQAAAPDYERDIRPLFAEKCAACHGALQQEAGLRLDAGKLIWQGSDQQPVIRPGNPRQSVLLERVTAEDVDLRMPPAEAGEPLSRAQQALLAEWIRAGAPFPADETIPVPPQEHWAYQPIRRPSLPPGPGHPVDRLLAAGRDPQIVVLPPAAPRARLRRVTLDLIGLPPSVAAQHRFEAHASQTAWEQWVDRLLTTPAYGERWGRHFMDIWRYSDWDGYKNQLRGSQRHIWRWRDWIVASLNEDKGYDRMILEMLAGDEIAPDDLDIVRATGFLARNYHHSNRNMWLDATVEHTAKAFLGLTINCARCHDHKYDPVAQREYYAMRAIFEPHQVRTERLPGQSDLLKQGLARVYDADLDVPTYLYVAGNDKLPDKEHPIAPGMPSIIDVPFRVQPVALSLAARAPDLRAFVVREERTKRLTKLKAARKTHQNSPSPLSGAQVDVAERELAALEAQTAADLDATPGNIKQAAAAEATLALAQAELEFLQKKAEVKKAAQGADRKKAEAALAAVRAKIKKLRKQEPPKAFASKRDTYPAASSGRRLALARWITDPQQPLTARVCVNHVWLRHFGQPLVDNVFDFGLRSPAPRQQALLDFLASELIASNWSLKHLHRLILTSAAYQRASSGPAETLAKNSLVDAENGSFWRFRVRRLEAEVIRDSLLHLGGTLDTTLGGPEIPHARGEEVPRRSLYFQHAYEKQMTLLTVFDGAGTTECYRRDQSIIPQQALALINAKLTHAQARALEERLTQAHGSDTAFIDNLFQAVLCRRPSAAEQAACTAFLKREREATPLATAESETRSRLVHVLFNHNDFVSVR